jgi:hypothetical protein
MAGIEKLKYSQLSIIQANGGGKITDNPKS